MAQWCHGLLARHYRLKTVNDPLSAAGLADHAADLVVELTKTEKAIEAFSGLADRLDALAAERARP